MCGICGFIGEIDERHLVLEKMTEAITHRGPDDSGFFEDKTIAMGFRRLSIIDLSTGQQPITNEDKTLVLTFNGEIYNYQALREELVSAGHIFASQSDSEVLVHGFEEWGEELLNRLRGMWAFAIYNTQDESLFIARDRFGIKPMHYLQTATNFVYGSEIKSILQFPGYEKRFNASALDSYLSFQYSVPPQTFFKDIYCLMPAHYLWYKDGKVSVHRYWEAKYTPNNNLDEETAVDMIDKAFEDSVEAHRIADVEVGCFLSSGVDSSYVASYFSGQRTFSVGFDFGEKYNETHYAESFAQEIETLHTSKLIGSDEYWEAIPKVQYYLDQPLADPSAIALYFVSKLASEHVKVVLSGEGADELFGGYTIYAEPGSRRKYQKIVPYSVRKAIARFARILPDIKGKAFLIRGAHPIVDTFIGNAFMFDVAEKRQLLKDDSLATRPQTITRPYYERVNGYDAETKMQYLDINLWMVGDILLKADRMSMANSLELRVPFLDKEVFNVASQLPTDLRVNKYNTKYALRCAALRHLPEATASKRKLGFPVPTRVWLREEKYYKKVKELFMSTIAEEFFNTEVLLGYLEDHFNGERDNSRKIWTVYSFLVWYEQYFADKTLADA